MREGERRDGLLRVQLRLEAVLRDQVLAGPLDPQREELGQLRIEADPGERGRPRSRTIFLFAWRSLAQFVVWMSATLHAGRLRDVVVDDQRDLVRELGQRRRTGPCRSPRSRAACAVLLAVDLLRREAVGERQQGVPGGVRADAGRGPCRPDPGCPATASRARKAWSLKPLTGLLTFVAEVLDHLVRDVQPALGDVVTPAHAVDVERLACLLGPERPVASNSCALAALAATTTTERASGRGAARLRFQRLVMCVPPRVDEVAETPSGLFAMWERNHIPSSSVKTLGPRWKLRDSASRRG